MIKEEGKYLIPPRLKTRMNIAGFYWEELLVIATAALYGFLRKVQGGQSTLLIVAAVLAVLLFKGFDNKSALTYLKLLFKFYVYPQGYSLKECDRNENK